MGDLESARFMQQKPVSERYPWITDEMLEEMWKLWVGNEGWNSLCIKFFEYILDQQPKQEQGNTLEQIEEAMLRAHCHGYMIRDALEYLAPKPKPKTPEMRVAAIMQVAFNQPMPMTYQAVAKQIVAALKEADRG